MRRQWLTSKKQEGTSTRPPDCPHQKIIEIYHEVLPELQRVNPDLWDGTRRTNLAARWKQSPKFQTLDFWRHFFLGVHGLDFYMGRKPGKDWKADLGWMVTAKGFVTLMEKIGDGRETRQAADGEQSYESYLRGVSESQLVQIANNQWEVRTAGRSANEIIQRIMRKKDGQRAEDRVAEGAG